MRAATSGYGRPTSHSETGVQETERRGCGHVHIHKPEMEQLAYLGLHGTKVDDDAVAQICKHLKQLTQLDLGQCSRVTSVALLYLQGLWCERQPAHPPDDGRAAISRAPLLHNRFCRAAAACRPGAR